MDLCFFLALLITLPAPPAAADTSYNVGGSAGWSAPTDPSFYEDWAANNTFHAGDSIVFKWKSMHGVLQVTSKSDYDKCTKSNGELKDTSPVTIPLKENGTFYFICTIASHCQLGQKVTIKVGNGISPSSSTSPPPPKSSAMKVTVFSCFLLLLSSFLLHFLA